tara:strand:+ start:831 stop:1217 length:387 start_codon:yes stop_codon:yes gene_type:complete
MRNKRVVYRDITFAQHPISRNLLTVSDKDAVKLAVKNLVMMKSFDKPFHPEINGGVYNLLFEPMTDVTSTLLKEGITDALISYESRIELHDVIVIPMYNLNTYQITILFSCLNQTEIQELGLALEVLR